jgi:hypothetical protein
VSGANNGRKNEPCVIVGNMLSGLVLSLDKQLKAGVSGHPWLNNLGSWVRFVSRFKLVIVIAASLPDNSVRRNKHVRIVDLPNSIGMNSGNCMMLEWKAL